MPLAMSGLHHGSLAINVGENWKVPGGKAAESQYWPAEIM